MVVLDANTLIRAVLWSRVLGLLHNYAGLVEFMAPEVAFQEARKIPAAPPMETFGLLTRLVQALEGGTYAAFEGVARERIDKRDEDDWPILAAALALGHPIRTEDSDLFGCGAPTWTTDRVELYLSKSAEQEAQRTSDSIGMRLKCSNANSTHTGWHVSRTSSGGGTAMPATASSGRRI